VSQFLVLPCSLVLSLLFLHMKDFQLQPLNFIMIDGTWSNSKAMVSRLQVLSGTLILFDM
jgi:DTW domain-containing protein YfiP